MKRSLTIFFQIIIVALGIGTLVLMLWEPHFEGRNVHATLFEIYFKDPFLAYAYFASISFFVALYQAFKVLGYVRENQTFSQATVKALQTIKYCGISLVGFILAAEAYLWIAVRGNDDIAGGVAMGFFLIIISAVIAIVAAVLERLLQSSTKYIW